MPNPLPLWEQNLRTQVANAERAGMVVFQVYRSNVEDMLRELDRVRAEAEQYKAAAAALETPRRTMERLARTANGKAPR